MASAVSSRLPCHPLQKLYYFKSPPPPGGQCGPFSLYIKNPRAMSYIGNINPYNPLDGPRFHSCSIHLVLHCCNNLNTSRSGSLKFSKTAEDGPRLQAGINAVTNAVIRLHCILVVDSFRNFRA